MIWNLPVAIRRRHKHSIKPQKTDFEKAKALNPENLPDYITRAKQRFSLGEFQAARGNAEKAQELLAAAIEDWTHVIKSAPEDAEAYSGRGLAKLVLGAAEGAITDFDKAVEIKPRICRSLLQSRACERGTWGNTKQHKQIFKRRRH